MSSDHQFLSFKGLKYYNPNKGWNEFDDNQKTHINGVSNSKLFSHPETKQPNESVKAPVSSASMFFDPLMKDLLDRVCLDTDDELSEIWKVIADEIDLLEQYASTKRELLEQMNLLDQETNELRSTIIEHLDEAQELADQQIFTAQLRAKISTVAQTRLLVKLEKNNIVINEPEVSNKLGATSEEA